MVQLTAYPHMDSSHVIKIKMENSSVCDRHQVTKQAIRPQVHQEASLTSETAFCVIFCFLEFDWVNILKL